MFIIADEKMDVNLALGEDRCLTAVWPMGIMKRNGYGKTIAANGSFFCTYRLANANL